MNTPAVSVIIVTYQGKHILPLLLDSLHKQTLPPAEIIIIDNTHHNRDFAKGYNTGIAKAQHPFILLLNQNIVCERTALEKLIHAMTRDERLGAVAPLLLRGASPHIIDTAGIQQNIFFRFTNIAEGTQNIPHNIKNRLIALSGAAMLLRKQAIDDIVSHGGGGKHEFFDEQFIAFKEDIDVGLRLRHRGWRIAVVPAAIMHYHRSAQQAANMLSTATQRHTRNFRINAYSLRNQWWVLLKNFTALQLLFRMPLVIPMECIKLLVILCTHPSTLRIMPSAIIGLPHILRKRRVILHSRIL